MRFRIAAVKFVLLSGDEKPLNGAAGVYATRGIMVGRATSYRCRCGDYCLDAESIELDAEVGCGGALL